MTEETLIAAKTFFLLVAAGGTLGGILNGINSKDNKLVLPKILPPSDQNPRMVHLGFIGDIIIGVGAAIAVFLVLTNALNLAAGLKTDITILSISILAGFAGITILKGMSEEFAKKVTKQIQPRLDSLETQIKEGDKSTSIYSEAYAHWKAKSYTEALEDINDAIDINPGIAKYYNLRAMVYRRLDRFDDAFNDLAQAVKIDPKYPLPYYNRACYKALKNKPVDEIIADLKIAFGLKASLVEYSQKDEDLGSIRENKDFKALLSAACAKT
jgi:tetratricopeptide (TPR) repeat protein